MSKIKKIVIQQSELPAGLRTSFISVSWFFSQFLLQRSCISHLDRARWDVESFTSLNLTPANQTPMLLDSSAQCNFLSYAGTHWGSELQLCKNIFHSDHASSSGHRSDVQHKNLCLGQLRNSPLLFRLLGPNPK